LTSFTKTWAVHSARLDGEGGTTYPPFFSLKSFAKIQKNLGQKNNHAHCGVLHLHLAGDPASNLLTEWLRVVVPTGEGAAHGHHAPDPSELVDARLEAAQGHNHAFRFFEALTLRYNRCLLAALDGARASEFDETAVNPVPTTALNGNARTCTEGTLQIHLLSLDHSGHELLENSRRGFGSPVPQGRL
jgi:hypothetical protein